MFKNMDAINKEFNGQWVFLINCMKDDTGTVLGGEVVLNSESRDKVIRGMESYIMEDSENWVMGNLKHLIEYLESVS